MPRRETISVAVYDRDEVERAGKMITRSHKHPKYVHGKVGMAMLLHKIEFVELRWYKLAWDKAIRLANPKMIAKTVCGTFFFLEGGRGGVCEAPKEGAVLCGMCEGTGRIWPRGKKDPVVTKRQAKDRLGCVVEGTEV